MQTESGATPVSAKSAGTTSRRVGIVMDERFLEHKTGHSHPEQPRRLAEIYRMIDKEFKNRLQVIQAKPATVEQVEMVHTPGHVRRILKTAEQRTSSMAPDTQVSAKTYLAAWLAAGACLQGVDMLMEKTVDAFFAIVRPPGHHALADRAGGFCIFNNIAVAARFAAKTYGLERILVVDWDIHHGNGINDLFYNDRRLYYYSTHDTDLYPYAGLAEETGEENGLGCTMNIPLVRKMNDDDMVYLYTHTLLPVMAGYRPQLIMVAAGFDAHIDDPIGRSRFTETLYGRLTRIIMDFFTSKNMARPPVLFTLEGGYDPRSLTRCVQSVLSALLEEKTPADTPENASPTTMETVELILGLHKKYGIIANP